MNGTDWIARGIAIFSVILTAVNVGVQILRHRADSAHIRLTIEFFEGEKPIGVPGPFSGVPPDLYAAPHYTVTATNTGRQPVTLKELRIYKTSGEFQSSVNRTLTQKMEPTEERSMTFFDISPIEHDVKRVCVLDTEGREWRFPRKQLKRWKKKIAAQGTSLDAKEGP